MINKIKSKIRNILLSISDSDIENFVDLILKKVNPLLVSTILVAVIIWSAKNLESSELAQYGFVLPFIYIISKIINNNKSKTVVHNYNKPSFDNAYFSDNKAITNALNLYLKESAKERLLVELIDSDIDIVYDDELHDKIIKYQDARADCWRIKKVRKHENGKYKETQIFNKTEKEYQDALQLKEECADELKKYIKQLL